MNGCKRTLTHKLRQICVSEPAYAYSMSPLCFSLHTAADVFFSPDHLCMTMHALELEEIHRRCMGIIQLAISSLWRQQDEDPCFLLGSLLVGRQAVRHTPSACCRSRSCQQHSNKTIKVQVGALPEVLNYAAGWICDPRHTL